MDIPDLKQIDREIVQSARDNSLAGLKKQLRLEQEFKDVWEEAFWRLKEIANPGQVRALQEATNEMRSNYAIQKRILENQIRNVQGR